MCAALIWQDRAGNRSLRLDVLVMPLVLWSFALLWAAIQLLPLEGSNLASPVWGLASSALGSDLPARISVNSAATLQSMMRFLTYVCIFLSTFIVAREARQGALLIAGGRVRSHDLRHLWITADRYGQRQTSVV